MKTAGGCLKAAVKLGDGDSVDRKREAWSSAACRSCVGCKRSAAAECLWDNEIWANGSCILETLSSYVVFVHPRVRSPPSARSAAELQQLRPFKIDGVKGACPPRLVSLHFPFSLSFVLAASLFLSCVFQVTLTWWLTAVYADGVRRPASSVRRCLMCSQIREMSWADSRRRAAVAPVLQYYPACLVYFSFVIDGVTSQIMCWLTAPSPPACLPPPHPGPLKPMCPCIARGHYSSDTVGASRDGSYFLFLWLTADRWCRCSF